MLRGEQFVTMSNEEYHAHEALGSSDVRRLMISPLHYKAKEEPATRPPHFVFGSAAHCGYLEPEKFVDRYRAKPHEVDGKGPRTSHYREFIDSHPEVEWMKAEDFDKVLRVVESAMDHPVSSKMFSRDVVVEGSVFFELRGVRCKARPDLVSFRKDGKVDVLDLKTTLDASFDGFRKKAVGAHKLHVQEWFYRKGLESLGLEVGQFVFLAVEKNAPHAAAQYVLRASDVELAEEQVHGALKAYLAASKEEKWAGYPTTLREMSVPRWALPDANFATNGEWLTIKEAMATYGVSRATLYNWKNAGTLVTRRFGGKRLVSARAVVV